VSEREASARIKINHLLESAGWRFFDDGAASANVCVEAGTRLVQDDLSALGDNFEATSKGYIDFLLLDARGFPFIVLEAKAEAKNPLVGKEQARRYARSQNCRFVILSNGNLHYFWDLERGNPHVITSFPSPDSVAGYRQVTPNPERLIEDRVDDIDRRLGYSLVFREAGMQRRMTRAVHRRHGATVATCRRSYNS